MKEETQALGALRGLRHVPGAKQSKGPQNLTCVHSVGNDQESDLRGRSPEADGGTKSVQDV